MLGRVVRATAFWLDRLRSSPLGGCLGARPVGPSVGPGPWLLCVGRDPCVGRRQRIPSLWRP